VNLETSVTRSERTPGPRASTTVCIPRTWPA
jgi:hypothetical protein